MKPRVNKTRFATPESAQNESEEEEDEDEEDEDDSEVDKSLVRLKLSFLSSFFLRPVELTSNLVLSSCFQVAGSQDSSFDGTESSISEPPSPSPATNAAEDSLGSPVKSVSNALSKMAVDNEELDEGNPTETAHSSSILYVAEDLPDEDEEEEDTEGEGEESEEEEEDEEEVSPSARDRKAF